MLFKTRFTKSVRRNLDRFPEDFMFELTDKEYNSLIISLRSHFVTSNDKGGRRHMPFAFTEHGVIMLAGLLRSELAMRNYIMAAQHVESELTALKAKLELLERNDEDNLEAINDLSTKPSESSPAPKKIGFK